MAYISITGLSKSYKEPNGSSIQVLNNVGLDVAKGTFVSVFGPNACGKTTLLNLVAGLADPDGGRILIGGKEPAESKIGYVFQDYNDSLFPWSKNIDNIAFSLEVRFRSRKQRHEYVRNYVREIGLDSLPLDKYPYQCSGGQQQLVALIRELIYDPDVLLLDEPFASLDYDRRISQQQHLLSSWERTQATILFVSHELDEAVFLSDRLVLLSQRPAGIAGIYPIDLPRPRTIDLLEQEVFFQVKVPILRKFREIIGK